MNIAQQSLWVLGHKVRPLQTDESYGMVEIVTPAGVRGPPPHFHKEEASSLHHQGDARRDAR